MLGTQQRKLLIDDSILDDSTSSPVANIHDLSGEDSSSEKILLPLSYSCPVNKGGSNSLGSRSGNRSDSAGSRKNSWSQLANLQELGTRCVFQVIIFHQSYVKYAVGFIQYSLNELINTCFMYITQNFN